MSQAIAPPNRLAVFFYGLALAVLVGFVLHIGAGVIIPLTISIFLSFLIVSLQKMVEATPVIGRVMPDWLSLILSFVVIVFVIFVLIQIVMTNAEALRLRLPEYRDRFVDLFQAADSYLRGTPLFADQLPEYDMQDLGDTIMGFLTEYGASAGSAIQSFGANLVTIILYTSFILAERGKIIRKLGLVASGEQSRLDVDAIVSDIGALVREYISVKTLTSFIVAALSYVILLLLGIDFAGFWAMLMFAFNFIPIIGSIVAVILPSVLALVQPMPEEAWASGFVLFALTLGLLTVAEQLVGSIIEPRLLGRSLNLSPVIILLSLAVWGSLWGFAGMLLCVPITVAIMIILSQFEETRSVAIMLSDNGRISEIKRAVTKSASDSSGEERA